MITAAQFAKQANDMTRQWLASCPGGAAGFLSEEPSYWAEQGIFTGEDLDRSMAVETYSDAYKEIHGIRPRWVNWEGAPAAEIWEAVKSLSSDGR